MQVGDEVTITPHELVAGGAALAKLDGFPVFAANVFPGDTARVRLTEVKKGFARAELVELVDASPLRRALPCPIAGDCGGCDWTALRLDAQLEAKQRILIESLRRIGKFDVASLPEITVHASPLNYRLRSRLHRDASGAVGFYAMRSNRVVPLSSACEVVGVETARTYGTDAVPRFLSSSVPRGTQRDEPDSVEDDDSSTGQIWEVDGSVITGDHELTLSAGPFSYRVSTSSFFQVNRHLLGTMVELVAGLASRVERKRYAVDLFAGTGFFTAPLATVFDHVTAVENAPSSVTYARMNAAKNVKIVDAPVERWMPRMRETDCTFLDPPRAGAKREVIETVGERTRESILYLSCDPVTFARDAQHLAQTGWELTSLDLLDLFPNTHHVETLGAFTRAFMIGS